MEDFPLIVHLLTLYMGAGLSFLNAVERICRDYEKKAEAAGGIILILLGIKILLEHLGFL